MAYNKKHGITPQQIIKEIKDIRDENRALIEQAESANEIKDPKDQRALIVEIEKKMHEVPII